jgi:polysaccharide deacetylase 2 family uncharacterized protein YibQ
MATTLDGDDDADLIRTITGDEDTGDEDEASAPSPMPSRREGFKHKLIRYLGYVFWPPFLRGDLGALNRRLLLAAWTCVLLLLAGAGGWLVTTGQSLPFLPGSEVVIGVTRLTLPPEAKLAPEQKAAAKPAPPDVSRLASGLLMAPDPALTEQTPRGPSPKIGTDGRQPWSAYARPVAAPASRPRIAIVLHDLGLNQQLTLLAAERLPPEISFSFNPYAQNLAALVERARTIGHEALLDLPMEPFDYPSSDPGPYTLLTSLNEDENIRRLDWALTRATGYIGFVSLMGGKYTSSPDHMTFVAERLKARGLMFVDARTAPRSVAARIMREAGGVYAYSNREIDQQPVGDLIDARLEELERTARVGGVAIGSARPYPVTLDRLLAWTGTLNGKGFDLVPISAIANRQTPE